MSAACPCTPPSRDRRHAPGSPGLVVVRTEPGLLVRPWKPYVPATALVADTVPPEVLPGLSQTDAVSAAFVGWVVELDVVVFPATHGASLEGSGRRLSERLVAAAGARMLDGACRDGAPIGLALCHHDHDDSPGRARTRCDVRSRRVIGVMRLPTAALPQVRPLATARHPACGGCGDQRSTTSAHVPAL